MVTRLDRGDGTLLAYELTPGRQPTLAFLPGFGSDMTGDKAGMLAKFASMHGHACLRLDYAGHGASGGNFADGTIGGWTSDALFLIDTVTKGPIVLVGSSMGGWIALLVALARPERIGALVGIAAAPDFTEDLIWASLPEAARATLLGEGTVRVPSAYGEDQLLTRALIEEGRSHLLLGAPIPLTCPLRLLHGQADRDVPWHTSLRLAERWAGEDVVVVLMKDGGHRLSRPQDMAALRRLVSPLLLQDGL
jgi:pimeloyl-ACP methyl ester carboxylesterase